MSNTKIQNFITAVFKAFEPDKAGIIIDCAENDITINQAICCARKGSAINLIAVYQSFQAVTCPR